MLLALANCAKRGTPTGGEKDETPPKMEKAIPALNTINFTGNKIRIYFNEYIKLKDIQKQLIVSPPLKYPPEIRPQTSANKFIEIKILDTLKENTTYVFNFGQSIIDNNESNPYNFFKYVFSTGDYIDSLTVNGKIEDALNRTPEPFVSVMLFEVDSTYTDSTVYKNTPTYITNTLDSINKPFQISNVRAGTYKLIALKDKNNNYLFDQKDDKIAFLEDEITVPTDSVYTLSLFKEITNFKASRPTLAAKNRIIFGYEGIPDKMKIDLLSKVPDTFAYKIIKDRETDTLHYWHTPIEADSLVFTITHEETIDTITLKTRELFADTLQTEATPRGTITLNEDLIIKANTPLIKTDSSKISIINKDSTTITFKTLLDEERNELVVDFNKEANQQYMVQMLPGALEDFFGETNDTLQYSLKTRRLSDYGNIMLTLQNVTSFPIIVELVTDKGDIIESSFGSNTSFNFTNIDPGKYYVRVIYDTNGNGKWDTGNYLLQQQPEKVVYYPKLIELRANWDQDETFILSN
jgi:uncharacterized protein (DUF2141 family)